MRPRGGNERSNGPKRSTNKYGNRRIFEPQTRGLALTDTVLILAVAVASGLALFMCLSPKRAALGWLATIAIQADMGNLHVALADLCLAALAISFCVSRARLVVPLTRITCLVCAFTFLFLILGTGTTILRYATVPTWTWLNKDLGLLLLVAAFLLVLSALRNEEPERVTRWFVSSAAIINGVVLLMWLLHLRGGWGAQVIWESSRLMGFMKDPNAFCGFIAVAAVLTFPSLVERGSAGWLRTTLALFALGTFLLSAVLTISRGGILALTVGLLATAFVLRSRFSIAKALCLFATAAILIGLVAQLSVWEDFLARVEDPATVNSRLELNDAAFRLYSESPVTLLTGTGVGSFVMTNKNDLGTQIHNTYIWLFVEGGPFMLIAFLALLCVAIRRAYSLARVDRPGHTAAAGCFGSLIALCVWCATVEGMYQREFWLVLVLVAILETQERARQHACNARLTPATAQ